MKGNSATPCALTILVDIIVVITELERLLKNLLTSIHKMNWHNDVMFVVSDRCIVGSKNQSVLGELAKPCLINTV